MISRRTFGQGMVAAVVDLTADLEGGHIDVVPRQLLGDHRGIFPARSLGPAGNSSAPRSGSPMDCTLFQPLDSTIGRNPDAGSENRSVLTFGRSFIDLERVQIDRPASLQ